MATSKMSRPWQLPANTICCAFQIQLPTHSCCPSPRSSRPSWDPGSHHWVPLPSLSRSTKFNHPHPKPPTPSNTLRLLGLSNPPVLPNPCPILCPTPIPSHMTKPVAKVIEILEGVANSSGGHDACHPQHSWWLGGSGLHNVNSLMHPPALSRPHLPCPVLGMIGYWMEKWSAEWMMGAA